MVVAARRPLGFVLRAILPLVLIFGGSLEAQAPSDALVAISQEKGQTLVRIYDLSGNPVSEFTIATDGSERFLSGRWGGGARAAVLAKNGSAKVVKFYDGTGTLTNQLPLSGSINSIFGVDTDASGTDELIVIEQEAARVKMHIYANPGVAGAAASTVSLPSTAIYYSPAVAGNSAVGIFAYSPKVTGASARRSARATRKNGKKKKPRKPKGNNQSRVQLFNFQGVLLSTLDMRTAIDGQIYPISPDGAAGFALREDTKFRMFNAQGVGLGDRPLPASSAIVVGNFTGAAGYNELMISSGTTVTILNLLGNTSTVVLLKGFPDQIAIIDAEIAKLRDRLIDGIRNGMTPSEFLEIQQKIAELEAQKKQFEGGGAVAPSLHRLFTGGAGSIEGVCDVVIENPADGYGGFLAKASDKNGGLVILTPGGKNYTQGKLLKFKTYKVIEVLQDAGYGNPDSHGMRKHFRAKRGPTAYGPYIFQAKLTTSFFDETGELHCFHVKKPSSRFE